MGTAQHNCYWLYAENDGKINTFPASWWWVEELAVGPYVDHENQLNSFPCTKNLVYKYIEAQIWKKNKNNCKNIVSLKIGEYKNIHISFALRTIKIRKNGLLKSLLLKLDQVINDILAWISWVTR